MADHQLCFMKISRNHNICNHNSIREEYDEFLYLRFKIHDCRCLPNLFNTKTVFKNILHLKNILKIKCQLFWSFPLHIQVSSQNQLHSCQHYNKFPPGKYNIINLLVMAIDTTNIKSFVFCISSLGGKNLIMYYWPMNVHKSKLKMHYIMGLALH